MPPSGALQSVRSNQDMCRFMLLIYFMSSAASFLTRNLSVDDKFAAPDQQRRLGMVFNWMTIHEAACQDMRTPPTRSRGTP